MSGVAHARPRGACLHAPAPAAGPSLTPRPRTRPTPRASRSPPPSSGTCNPRLAGRNHHRSEESAGVRNAALHHLLESLTVDASGRLAAELAAGAEMPFE